MHFAAFSINMAIEQFVLLDSKIPSPSVLKIQ